MKSVREVFAVETHTLAAHSVDLHESEVKPGSSRDAEEMFSEELVMMRRNHLYAQRGSLCRHKQMTFSVNGCDDTWSWQRRRGLCGFRGFNHLKTMVCYVYA